MLSTFFQVPIFALPLCVAKRNQDFGGGDWICVEPVYQACSALILPLSEKAEAFFLVSKATTCMSPFYLKSFQCLNISVSLRDSVSEPAEGEREHQN